MRKDTKDPHENEYWAQECDHVPIDKPSSWSVEGTYDSEGNGTGHTSW